MEEILIKLLKGIMYICRLIKCYSVMIFEIKPAIKSVSICMANDKRELSFIARILAAIDYPISKSSFLSVYQLLSQAYMAYETGIIEKTGMMVHTVDGISIFMDKDILIVGNSLINGKIIKYSELYLVHSADMMYSRILATLEDAFDSIFIQLKNRNSIINMIDINAITKNNMQYIDLIKSIFKCNINNIIDMKDSIIMFARNDVTRTICTSYDVGFIIYMEDMKYESDKPIIPFINAILFYRWHDEENSPYRINEMDNDGCILSDLYKYIDTLSINKHNKRDIDEFMTDVSIVIDAVQILLFIARMAVIGDLIDYANKRVNKNKERKNNGKEEEQKQ